MKQGVLLILGRKGSGKSLLARAYLRHPSVKRSIAIDTHGEFGGVQITDPWALSEYLNRRNEGTEQPFRVAYRDRGNHSIPLPQVFEMLQKCKNSTICFEESSQWVNEPAMNWFLQYGRHNAISVVLVARRPKQEVGPMGRAQADVIITFPQQELADLEWIEKVSDSETAARVAAMPRCTCTGTFNPECGGHVWEYVLRGHSEIEAILEELSEGVEDDTGTADVDTNSSDSGSAARDLVPVEPDSEGDGSGQVGDDRPGPAGGVLGGGDPASDGTGKGAPNLSGQRTSTENRRSHRGRSRRKLATRR